MAIALTSNNGTAEDYSGGGATSIQSSAFSCSSGNAIAVIAFGYLSGSPGVSSVSDTAGNTYTKIRDDSIVNRTRTTWLAQNITGHASNQVTANYSGGDVQYRYLIAVEFSGVATSSAHDTGFTPAATESASSPLTSPSDDTAENGEWIVAGADVSGAGPTWSGSGGSSIAAQTTYMCMVAKEVATAGAATISVGFTAGTVNLFAVALKAAAASLQYARPASDVADGNWLNESSSNTNLYASIDEATADDDDYIRSGATPSNDTCTVGLSSIGTPDAGTVTIRVRAKTV